MINDYFLIEYQKRPAAWNMAADLFFMRKSAKSEGNFLRLYSWDNPTVSFGKNQKIDLDKLNILKSYGYSVVKRPSGGRAVLHKNDLTYCFTANLNEFEDKSLKNVYNIITQPFVISLKEYALDVRNKSRNFKDYFDRFLCFDSTSYYELDIDDKKVIGSAQYRDKNSVLQHGSMYYENIHEKNDFFHDYTKNIFVFKPVQYKEFRELIIKNFEKVFNIKFKIYNLTQEDLKNIETLEKNYIYK